MLTPEEIGKFQLQILLLLPDADAMKPVLDRTICKWSYKSMTIWLEKETCSVHSIGKSLILTTPDEVIKVIQKILEGYA